MATVIFDSLVIVPGPVVTVMLHRPMGARVVAVMITGLRNSISGILVEGCAIGKIIQSGPIVINARKVIMVIQGKLLFIKLMWILTLNNSEN